jgi:glycosyltransferase involved in cell wall biosynthesis
MPDQSNLGGATVSLNYLVEYLKKHKFFYQLLDTQRFKNPFRMLLNPIYVLTVFLLKIPFVDVVFVNVSQGGTRTIAPIFYFLSKVFGKKFVFRPFGGAMQDHYEQYANWQKWLFEKTLLQSDIFFLQTRELVDFFKPKGKHVLQLATSRNQPSKQYLRPHRPFQKRFVFLGHVNEYKGLDVILEAIQALDTSYTIDIYGPIQEGKYRSIFAKSDNYKGVLSKENVLPTLREYDVLILPTFYRGEGYPGAIIEAYSIGLPVISTQWRAIPEIVENEVTGRLISPKSVDELVGAILSFEENHYAAYSVNARNYFCEHFETEVVTERAMEAIEKLK